MTITQHRRGPASISEQLGMAPRRIPDGQGGTCSAVLDLSNPATWPGSIPFRPHGPDPYRQHRMAAEKALAQFEASGDLRHGLAALAHAILSIDVREAGQS